MSDVLPEKQLMETEKMETVAGDSSSRWIQ